MKPIENHSIPRPEGLPRACWPERSRGPWGNMRASAPTLAAMLLLGGSGICPARDAAAEPHPLLPAYERAAAVQAQHHDRWVLNQDLYPRWIDDGAFWYVRQTPEGSEYTLVDARLGEKRPAFDHQALARSLAEASGEETDAARSCPMVSRRHRSVRRNVHGIRPLLAGSRRVSLKNWKPVPTIRPGWCRPTAPGPSIRKVTTCG